MNHSKRITIYYKAVVGPGLPGKAAYAFTVYQNEEVLYTECRFIGELGNLSPIQAQYMAIFRVFDWLLKQPHPFFEYHHIRLYGDNQFVVNQINGIYTKTMDNTEKMNGEIQTLARKFRDIGFIWLAKSALGAMADLAEKKLAANGIIVEKRKEIGGVKASA